MTEIDDLEKNLAAKKEGGSYGHAINGILASIGASRYFPDEDPQIIDNDVKQRLMAIYKQFGPRILEVCPEKYKQYIIENTTKEE